MWSGFNPRICSREIWSLRWTCISVRISPKLRWNVGYQFYNYSERFHVFDYNQNFHAHTGYTSVLWAF